MEEERDGPTTRIIDSEMEKAGRARFDKNIRGEKVSLQQPW